MRPGLRYVSKADVRADKAARLNLIRMETSMLARLFATISVAALLLAVTMISASDAGFRRLRSSYEPGEVITARSHHGNGIISSVVRPGQIWLASTVAGRRLDGLPAQLRRDVARRDCRSHRRRRLTLEGLRNAVARMRRLRLPPLGILVLSRSEFRQETDWSGARGRIAPARHDRR